MTSELETDALLSRLLNRPLGLDFLVSSGFASRTGPSQCDQPRLDKVVLAVFEFESTDDASRLERRS